jgi:hypothetical protein
MMIHGLANFKFPLKLVANSFVFLQESGFRKKYKPVLRIS